MAAGRACASLCGLALAAAALTVTAAGAEQPPRRVDAESMFTAALHELSERDLKARYLQCSQAALQGQLGSQEIALCSLGYEVLLRRVFGGDYLALFAWSRSEGGRGATVAGDAATAAR